ncbi:MAG: anthranilate phosphoribosyltransferase, partial [Corynebacterium variabile]
LMAGEIEGAVKDAVLINAAAALAVVKGWEDSDLHTVLTEQVAVAREVLESGKAKQAMDLIVNG